MRSIVLQWAGGRGWPLELVPDFGAMLVVAMTAGAAVTLALWMRRGHRWSQAARPIALALPLLFLGAKLLYLAQYGFSWSRQAWTGGGMSLYGGLLGVLCGLALAWLWRRYQLLELLDCLAPALGLGFFFGRLGCFLHGCNGGVITLLPWAVRFPAGTPVFEGQFEQGLIDRWSLLSLPVHPTQLYESAFGLLSFFSLLLLLRHRRFPGEVIATGLGAYAAFRFVNETIRSDSGGWHPWGVMTFAQMISLLLIAAALACYALAPRPRPVADPL